MADSLSDSIGGAPTGFAFNSPRLSLGGNSNNLQILSAIGEPSQAHLGNARNSDEVFAVGIVSDQNWFKLDRLEVVASNVRTTVVSVQLKTEPNASYLLGGATWTFGLESLLKKAGQAVAHQPLLLPALGRIVELAKLPANWDAEDADPPTAVAVAAACYLIEAVAGRQRRNHGQVSPITSSPIPDGGLQIEWQGPNARIDIQANPSGSYGYLAKWGVGPSTCYEEANEAPLELVLGLIDRVLDS